MSHLLDARGLVRRFGNLVAVDGLDLQVDPGEIVAFLGPNGAGKSTTMRMIAGSLTPTRGSVEIDGRSLHQDRLAAQRRFGYLPEGAPADGDARVDDMLGFVAGVHGLRGSARREAVRRVLRRLDLEHTVRQRVNTLSKGFQRRLGLAMALLHDPPLLLLDEPTDGLDPNQKRGVRSLILELAGRGAVKAAQGVGRDAAEDGPGGAASSSPRPCGVLLCTHLLEEVEAVCTRAVVICRGRIVFDGTPTELDALAPSSVTHRRLDHVFRLLTRSDLREQPMGTGEVAA